MTTIEYLSMSKPRQILYNIGAFFKSIPLGIASFFRKLPTVFMKLLEKISNPFLVLKEAMLEGDWKVRLSFLICGFGEITRKQKARGILSLFYEIAFIVYMILMGAQALAMLPSLGYVASGYLIIDVKPYTEYFYIHNSFTILLYSILTFFLIAIMVVVWYLSIHDSFVLYRDELIGRYSQDSQFFKDLTGKNYHAVLLSVPLFGLVMFTIIPVILMVLIGFTNYGSEREFPVRLFDWVGLTNYNSIFAGGNENPALMAQTFVQVVAWTLIWAIFATFSNYFLGMVVAIMINSKGIKLKKMWRTILITTIAVPQFVSLLLISRMFQKDSGFINAFLMDNGLITNNINWMGTFPLTNVMIIIINMWVGIPYMMLSATGILMNIPADLYESSRVDGANSFQQFTKITLPYMLFVTGPSLLTSFVGNLNSFNIIYLLSGGGPTNTKLGTIGGSQVGHTDLLITFLFKVTTGSGNKYYLASVLGIFVFVVVALLSLVVYNVMPSTKNEEDYS